MIDSRFAIRVALVISSAARGGAEQQLVRLAVRLRTRGIDARVWFTRTGGPLTAELDEQQVPWEILTSGSMPKSVATFGAVIRMSSRLLQFRPDIVFAWLPGAIMMTLPLAALLTRAQRVAAFRGRQVLIDENQSRGLAPLLKKFVAPVLMRHAVRHAQAVVVNAPHLREQAIHFRAVPTRIHYIPNGVAVPKPVATVDVQPPTAIVVANFNPWKGHDVLVDALALVNAPLQVVLVGSGVGRALIEDRAIRSGVRERLRFAEQPVDVLKELLSAQFAIHPSRTEGLPNAVLEELAVGLPVVATNVGGTSLLIEDGRTGYLVPPDNASALADRIEALTTSPECRTSMTIAARERASQYSWESCVDRYAALFTELIEGRS